MDRMPLQHSLLLLQLQHLGPAAKPLIPMPSMVAIRTIWPCGMPPLRSNSSKEAKVHRVPKVMPLGRDDANVAETSSKCCLLA